MAKELKDVLAELPVDGAETSGAQDGERNINERETWGGKVEFLLTCIAFAVGLGNVWRFPYLCYSNGGGAFLVPYTLMLAMLGLPLFYLELAVGQYASLGPISVWRLCPLFKGIGYTMITVSTMVSIYYNVIIGFTLFYLFASFTSELPWSHCNNTWNTANCREFRIDIMETDNETVSSLQNTVSTTVKSIVTTSIGQSNVSDLVNLTDSLSKLSTPAEEYWQRYVLDIGGAHGIGHLGNIRWHLCLCLLLAWIVVYLCIMKGIKSSGKVVYFTAIFPYIILFALFIRGITLPGAGEGIKFYLLPDFKVMMRPQVWKDAAVQILYSLGASSGSLLAMSSYNKFNNNCYKDAILVACVNCGTSVFAGTVIFSVLGFMAHVEKVSVDHVVKSGPGLAFIVYPEALSKMAGAPFWSIAFFFMLFILGLGSQFPGIECISTAFVDEFPVLRRYKSYFTLFLCSCMFILGLPCVTQGGQYVIALIDKYATSFPLLTVALLEGVIISWIYGLKRFSNDIKTMMGFEPNYYWKACWAVLTPTIAFCIMIATAIEYHGITYGDYHYPPWAEAIGWLIMVFAIMMIPVWMVAIIYRHVGSWKNFAWIFRGPTAIRALNLKALVQPTESWGPANDEDRLKQELTLDKDVSSRAKEEQKIIDQEESNPNGLLSSPLANPNYGVNTDSYI